ncbi:MAG: T9SS type A sorting domain-containing protein [Bacteroidales bacterium]|nr:T9SS type A sorting domain-containing protein [Bacteroidales bacterium]
MVKIYFSILLIFLISTIHAQLSLQWVFSAGSNSSESPVKIAVDSFENIYVLGDFSNEFLQDIYGNTLNLSSNGSSDIFLLKYNKDMQLIWAISFGGNGIDRSKDFKIVDNYLVITGFFSNSVDFDASSNSYTLTSNGNYDIFLLKYSLNGNFVWVKQIGGIGPDIGRSIAILSNHDILLTGEINATVDFDPSDNVFNLSTNGISGITDVFIAKYNSNGQFIWAIKTTGNSYTYSYSITTDYQNNIYIIGTYFKTVDFDPGTGTYNLTAVGTSCDVYIAKYSPTGNLIWVKSIGGTKNDFINEIALDNNSLYAIGHFQDIVDFDPSPSVLYKTSQGQHDIFLVKFDLNGNFIWVNTFGSTGSDLGTSCMVDSSNNIYILGAFQGTVDFDPGTGTSILSAMGSYDTYLCQYTSSGQFLNAKKLQSLNDDRSVSITFFQNNLYLLGSYTGTLNFEVNPFSYTSSGQQDLYIAKYKICYAQLYHYFVTINQYQTYNFNNQILTTAGTYYDTLPDKYGCDSTIVLHLTINNSPLPVNLISFNVICTSTGAKITWTTASETNNDYFTVEKSTDLLNWKIISTLKPLFANSNVINHYSIFDNELIPDIPTYYRLKQTDLDGNFQYFDVRSILCNTINNELNIIGINISENNINLLIQTNGFSSTTISLYNVYGQLIKQQIIKPTKGINQISFQQLSIKSGVYLIDVVQNGEKKSKKIYYFE